MEDERIYDGDFVICVDYIAARGFAQVGDVVVAERRRGGLLERSCKKLATDDRGGLCLMSRSSDPRFKGPIPLAAGNEEVEVVLVGLVVGTFRPLW